MKPVLEPGKAVRRSHWLVIASVLVLVAYFAITAFHGLSAYFTQDDGGNLLNMHKYWQRSLLDVLGSAVCVVTRAYRPLGGVYYFILYKLAGFNPFPFRAVCLVLMLANVLLAFALIRRLSGSLLAGLFGAVVITNHPAMLEFLFSSGTIYDILCFLFYFLAVRCYFVWRQEGQMAGAPALSWRQLAVILILTGCALDSKEMAMTLPAALLLLELVYFPPNSWSWRRTARFAVHQGRGALATAALVAPTIAVKVLTRNPLSDDSAYAAHSVRATVEGMRTYQHFLLYNLISPQGLSTLGLLSIWAAMGVAAIALRSRAMKFGLGFLVASMVPICLISRWAGYELYIPLMGWALYAGSLLQLLCGGLVRGLPLRFRTPVKFAVFMVAAVAIVHTHAALLVEYSTLIRNNQNDMRQLIGRLRGVHPQLPRGSRLLLVDDSVQTGYEVLFLARLAYADPALDVDRIKMLRAPPDGAELIRYDFVLAGGWDLHDVRGVSDARAPVQVRFEPLAVRPREGYSVEVPELAGQTTDLATRTIVGNSSDRAVTQERCTLDLSGRAPLIAPPNFRPGTIQVRWVRTQGGDWMSASGSLGLRQ